MILFVYGTLRQGGSNNKSFLSNSKYLGKDKVKDFALYSIYGLPVIMPKKDWSVVVEVYEINTQTLEEIDRLEGTPFFYKRKEVTSVAGKTGFIYYQENSGNEQVEGRVPMEHGDWKKWSNGIRFT